MSRERTAYEKENAMLVLMRHGQASFGAAHYDRLSGLGVAQATATGEFLKARDARHVEVCIGPRERHRHTAQALLQAWGAEPTKRDVDDIDEFADSAQIIAATGVLHEGRSDMERMLLGIDGWAAGWLVIESRPSFAEFRARVGRWLARELDDAHHDSPRLVVTSAGVVAAAMCEAMRLPDEAFVPLACQIRNASLTEITLSRGRAAVVSFNGTGHLANHLLTAI
ncbi:MAG: histidine phosphatase family protein [Comamonadaceae bacterium]|nr:MAG: histidine phosphatase family protein [Comamonadaceae bacterium]